SRCSLEVPLNWHGKPRSFSMWQLRARVPRRPSGQVQGKNAREHIRLGWVGGRPEKKELPRRNELLNRRLRFSVLWHRRRLLVAERARLACGAATEDRGGQFKIWGEWSICKQPMMGEYCLSRSCSHVH